MLQSYNICVQYTESEENNLNNAFNCIVPSFPVLHFSWSPPNQILQFDEHLPARYIISTCLKRLKETPQWLSCSEAQEYELVIQM